MIIGAQGFTIRDYAQNEADFRETAKKLHEDFAGLCVWRH